MIRQHQFEKVELVQITAPADFPQEILTAVTINAACAIGRQEQVGTLEPGKKADLVIWDAPDMEMLCYRFGSNLAIQTIKGGIIV